LAAYAAVFPDYSVTQTQRLSDSAYNANTIVPQGQSKVLVVFLPQSVLFTKENRKKFWHDPNAFIRGEYSCNGQGCPPALTKVRAHVKAQFIVDLSDTPPALAPKAISLNTSEQAGIFTPGTTVHGTIVGNYLGGATLSIVSTNKDDFTLTTTKVTDGEIDFTIQAKKVEASPLSLTFSVTKAKATVTQDLVLTK
jgi:hypothetical protein